MATPHHQIPAAATTLSGAKRDRSQHDGEASEPRIGIMALMPPDPEEAALLIVQQFLRERGMEEALHATERSTGLNFVDDKLGRGSLLMEMVYERMEKDMAESVSDMEIAEREEEEGLLKAGPDDAPREECVREFAGLHSQNILAVTMWPEAEVFFTGAGDQTVRCIDTSSQAVKWSCSVGGGAVLALALHPDPGTHPLLLASSMDGTVSLLDAKDGVLIHSSKAHAKYAHRVAWSSSGRFFSSASHDATVRVYRCKAAGESGGEDAESPFQELWHLPFASTVEDIEPLQGDILAIATRSDYFFRLLDLSGSPEEVGRVNMNAHGDSHLSFVAKHLTASPEGQYLLVSTDVGRIIMMNTSTWKQVRNFYGVPHENFGNPCAAWSPSRRYIIAGAAGGNMWVFHVGSSKVVRKIKAHSVNVRHLEADSNGGLLATCSYDKTVKLWTCQTSSGSL